MAFVDYESSRILNEYLHFHYARPEEQFPWVSDLSFALNYPARIVSERLAGYSLPSGGRGLDVGCAVGRTAFEMARFCDEVVGVDYSAEFIRAASALAVDGEMEYQFVLQGARMREFLAEVPKEIDRTRVTFMEGDAHALPQSMGSFDWVTGVNLLCRLAEPQRFLDQLPSLVNSGGLLLLNSPFSWLPEHTPPSNWIGGSSSGPGSEQELRNRLKSNFEFIDAVEMPFLIRETERKYQLTFAHSSLFRRR